jgi:hypothetical protein
MTDIGFVLLKMNNDKIYDDILQTVKEFENNYPNNQMVIFNSYSEKINTYNLPILHLNQSQFLKGTLIIFDLPSIIVTNKFPNINRRILFANNIPWQNNTQTTYSEWISLYNQDNLDIITSSKELYDIYNICWKEPLGICEGFKYENVKKFIQ